MREGRVELRLDVEGVHVRDLEPDVRRAALIGELPGTLDESGLDVDTDDRSRRHDRREIESDRARSAAHVEQPHSWAEMREKGGCGEVGGASLELRLEARVVALDVRLAHRRESRSETQRHFAKTLFARLRQPRHLDSHRVMGVEFAQQLKNSTLKPSGEG